ncbi:GNAT family N-acetyltransferase [Kribbella sp. NPDC051620]|uniref:GNAT family N-acetyltransferase n=1 Tax=Kribbella sp. NPDC051620 TaxID=3364120 RepID=UPI0037B85457
MSLRIEHVTDGPALADWQFVHNEIIPTDPLSLDVIRGRAQRRRLTVAYDGDVPVGCATVRPPEDETPAATLIVRVLPAHRRQGFGEQLYLAELPHAQALADSVETVVLESNQDGLRFALAHGFVETERYLLPGDTIPFITLRSADC